MQINLHNQKYCCIFAPEITNSINYNYEEEIYLRANRHRNAAHNANNLLNGKLLRMTN